MDLSLLETPRLREIRHILKSGLTGWPPSWTARKEALIAEIEAELARRQRKSA